MSDAEREHVGQLLQRAVGQGMLSLGEFTERMDTALVAKTRGELNSVLVDLPGMQISAEHRPSSRYQPPNMPQPGYVPQSTYKPEPTWRAGQLNVIKARMSTVSRKGPWNVPPSLFIDSRVSSIALDFTQAIMTTQVVEVTVDDYCSSISLVVPAEATVDLDGVDSIGASINNKVRTGSPIGRLHIVVRGKIRFGSLTAKNSFATSLRRIFE